MISDDKLIFLLTSLCLLNLASTWPLALLFFACKKQIRPGWEACMPSSKFANIELRSWGWNFHWNSQNEGVLVSWCPAISLQIVLSMFE